MAFIDSLHVGRALTGPNAAARLRGLVRGWRSAYAEWRDHRDYEAISSAFAHLSERQLNRIGMSRATLPLDLADLMARAEDGRAYTAEIEALLAQGTRSPAPLRLASHAAEAREPADARA